MVVSMKGFPRKSGLRLAIFGLSGTGKSTTAGLIEANLRARGMTVERLKLAEPLYKLQREFYKVAGVPIGAYDQDQELMESIASHLRRIAPECISQDFKIRLEACCSDVVINDDLRDPHIDYRRLRLWGFHTIKTVCPESVRARRLATRGDLSVIATAPSTSGLGLIPADYELENAGNDIHIYAQSVNELVDVLLDDPNW